MSLLAGERPVLFTHRSVHCQLYMAIIGCRQRISRRDLVIDIHSHQWQHG
ncbi:unnamed protein product [Staurois parvus]|uniref:Uncharacterized protein n=1 Tax=Staurois parvus TaxID=386267 RepID=A0ABN9D3C2_9NEOB|nr:unnamed protein product [Staurois parvus]